MANRLRQLSQLTSSKYDLEDAINNHQAALEDLLLNDPNNRDRISNRVDRIENLSARLAGINTRIQQLETEIEQNPIPQPPPPPTAQNRQNARNNGRGRRQRGQGQGQNHHPVQQQNHLFYQDPAVSQRFSHIFANAGANVNVNMTNGANNVIAAVNINNNEGLPPLENINNQGEEYYEDEEFFEDDEADDVIELNPMFFQMLNQRINAIANGGQQGPNFAALFGAPMPNDNANMPDFMMNPIVNNNNNINNNPGAIFQQLIQMINTNQNANDYEYFSNLPNVPVPIKEEVLGKIKTIKYSDIDKKSTESRNVQCSVCLCDFESDDLVKHLRCDHIYHNDCISEWFKTKSTCPVCKLDLNEKPRLAPKKKPIPATNITNEKA